MVSSVPRLGSSAVAHGAVRSLPCGPDPTCHLHYSRAFCVQESMINAVERQLLLCVRHPRCPPRRVPLACSPCALAPSSALYINNLTIFNSGTAWPHIAGVTCGQHRVAWPSLLRGHPPRRDVLGKQQLAQANLAPSVQPVRKRDFAGMNMDHHLPCKRRRDG